jgi:hypothetical protein
VRLAEHPVAVELQARGPDGPSVVPAERVADGQRPEQEAEYVTEVSVPNFGDGGIQRLHSRMREPEPVPELEPEAEAGI